jgi:hypothetical protein
MASVTKAHPYYESLLYYSALPQVVEWHRILKFLTIYRALEFSHVVQVEIPSTREINILISKYRHLKCAQSRTDRGASSTFAGFSHSSSFFPYYKLPSLQAETASLRVAVKVDVDSRHSVLSTSRMVLLDLNYRAVLRFLDYVTAFRIFCLFSAQDRFVHQYNWMFQDQNALPVHLNSPVEQRDSIVQKVTSSKDQSACLLRVGMEALSKTNNSNVIKIELRPGISTISPPPATQRPRLDDFSVSPIVQQDPTAILGTNTGLNFTRPGKFDWKLPRSKALHL